MLNLLFGISFILYFLGLSWNTATGFWLCIEAAGLVLVGCFFSSNTSYNRYLGLLNYLLISGLGSAMLLSGVMSDTLNSFVTIGMMIKVGSVPFIGWVLVVYNNCSWMLLYFFSVISKVILLYVPNLCYGTSLHLLLFSGSASMLLLAWILWSNGSGIKSYLAISGISSGIILLILALGNSNIPATQVYIVYLLVNTVNFLVFYQLANYSIESLRAVFYFFLLVAIPVSLAFLYKITVILALLNISFLLVVLWVVYGISEQLFLSIFLFEKFCCSNYV